MRKLFRFQDFEIWKLAIEIGGELCVIADRFEDKKHFKFAEQLRGAALSISNNIAEGSGSVSDKDFAHFLNIARRSAFENANMLMFFVINGHLPTGSVDELLVKLETESRMIEGFRKSLCGV